MEVLAVLSATKINCLSKEEFLMDVLYWDSQDCITRSVGPGPVMTVYDVWNNQLYCIFNSLLRRTAKEASICINLRMQNGLLKQLGRW